MDNLKQISFLEKYDREKKTGMNSRKRKKLVFYCLILLFPLLQFSIFYIVVNFNAIILSFKSYYNGEYLYVGFDNFKKVFNDILYDSTFRSSMMNSVKVLGIDFIIILPLTLFFSFYIAKEYLFSKFFRVTLFIPTIVSSIVMVLIYKNILEEAVPAIVKIFNSEKKVDGFLSSVDPTRRLISIFVYYVWISFGTSVILYTGSMSGISKDIIEAANLDGASGFKEFWHVSLPGIYPTIVVLSLAKLTGFFTNKLNLFSFYGTNASFSDYTVGYYLFKNTYGDLATMSVFPYLSAMGIVFTIVIAPITIFLKYFLEKVGPSED